MLLFEMEQIGTLVTIQNLYREPCYYVFWLNGERLPKCKEISMNTKKMMNDNSGRLMNHISHRL